MSDSLYAVFLFALLAVTFTCGYLVGIISSLPKQTSTKVNSRSVSRKKKNDAPTETDSFEGFRSLNRNLVPPEVK